MKKLIIAASLGFTPLLAQADGASGCGWGALLFDGNEGLASHVLAATTNVSSGNNTFGMSSGTNGCTVHHTIQYKGGKQLVQNNMDRLAREIAQGEGETVSALSVLWGVDDADRPVFRQVLQHNFDRIYPHENVTSDEVLQAVITVMQEDAVLSKYTDNLS